VDHLVYAVPELDAGVAELERRLGRRATPGGKHPGRGTWNALMALGPSSYLEILAPDPEQEAPAGGRWFEVDGLAEARLITWAAKSADLERQAARAASLGAPLGAVRSGSRRRPDGTLLEWRYTDPTRLVAGGVAPFLIDWGTSAHPAESAARGLTLIALRAEHPDPARATRLLDAVGVSLPVVPGPRPSLIATLRTARGDVELR
jgi:hypothetical protein